MLPPSVSPTTPAMRLVLVSGAGLEPTFSGSKPDVLPLDGPEKIGGV